MLSIIVAKAKNNIIGKDNNLIWSLKEDLKFFKETTTGHKIVMGYNTFKSLPKLLPNREHLVLTHKDLKIDGIKVFNDFKALTEYLESLDEEIYIIGGSAIYKLFIDYADELILTEINAECLDADAYFPNFNKDKYDKELIKENVEENIEYSFVRYRKKDNNAR